MSVELGYTNTFIITSPSKLKNHQLSTTTP